MKRPGQWQWIVNWSPLWLPIYLLAGWAIYRDFTGDRELWTWLRENVLVW